MAMMPTATVSNISSYHFKTLIGLQPGLVCIDELRGIQFLTVIAVQ
jgi:hypothetical protein